MFREVGCPFIVQYPSPNNQIIKTVGMEIAQRAPQARFHNSRMPLWLQSSQVKSSLYLFRLYLNFFRKDLYSKETVERFRSMVKAPQI